MSAERRTFYLSAALRAMPRLLGTLDRDPTSPTAGSFDRDHWAWKFRDFPITMLQSSVLPLAAVWSLNASDTRYARSPVLLGWIESALRAILRRQRRNGAFDSVGPNTQDHGVTLAMAFTLATTVRTLGEAALPGELVASVRAAIRRCTDFARRSQEDYAFISNHQALFALAWRRAGEFLGDDSLGAQGDRVIQEILNRQSSEGWYEEYGGADPGYETLGVNYLAQYQRERPSPALAQSLQRAVEFLSHFVHPDGSVGGAYGSRGTSLWFPAGFELLRGEVPMAGAIAEFVASKACGAGVVTPDTTDAHNLPVLAYSYLLAAEALRSDSASANAPSVMPCVSLRGARHFAHAGLLVVGADRYYAVSSARRGGVGRVHSRAGSGVVFQDAGYVVISNGARWASGIPAGAERSEQFADGCLRLSAPMGRASDVVLTPWKFVVLRLLNLTVFRSEWLGRLVRRAVIERLITGRERGPFTLHREIRFAEDRITYRDVLMGARGARVAQVGRPATLLARHMGSSHYFHQRDLAEGPPFDAGACAEALRQSGRAGRALDLLFAADGSASWTERALARDELPRTFGE